jgi:hypothetical protein
LLIVVRVVADVFYATNSFGKQVMIYLSVIVKLPNAKPYFKLSQLPKSIVVAVLVAHYIYKSYLYFKNRNRLHQRK